jgi:hypothetical protein
VFGSARQFVAHCCNWKSESIASLQGVRAWNLDYEPEYRPGAVAVDGYEHRIGCREELQTRYGVIIVVREPAVPHLEVLPVVCVWCLWDMAGAQQVF